MAPQQQQSLPRRRRLSPSDREQQIVEGAVRFFAEVGFDGQTRELAQRLGITQPLLYRYFPNKNELIERVFKEVYLNRFDANWATLIKDRSKALKDRLCEFYESYSQATYHHDWIRIYMFSGLRGEKLNKRYIRVVESRILRPICVEIRHHCNQPPCDENAISQLELESVWVLHSGLFYYAVRKHIYKSKVSDDFPAIVAQAVSTMLKGVKAI